VQEITAASKEQDTGAEQINKLCSNWSRSSSKRVRFGRNGFDN